MASQHDPSDPGYRSPQEPTEGSADTLTGLVGYRIGIPTMAAAVEAASRAEAWKKLRREARFVCLGMVAGQLYGMITRPDPSVKSAVLGMACALFALAVVGTVYWLIARAIEKARIERALKDPAAALCRYYDRLLKRALKRLTGPSGELAKRIEAAKESKSLRVAIDRDALLELHERVERTARMYREHQDWLTAVLSRYPQVPDDGQAYMRIEIDRVCGQLELHGRALQEFGRQLRKFDALGVGLSTFIDHAKIAVKGLPLPIRLSVSEEPVADPRTEGDEGADTKVVASLAREKKG